MLCLRVRINDRPAVVGGAEDLGVLNTVVTATGVLGNKTSRLDGDEADARIHLRLGGLTSRAGDQEDEHLMWLTDWNLKVGDFVHIEIIEATESAEVCERKLAGGKSPGSSENAAYEHVKKMYLEMKAKFEPGDSESPTHPT